MTGATCTRPGGGVFLVSLREVGIEQADLDELARRALDYRPLKANPRPKLLELAW